MKRLTLHTLSAALVAALTLGTVFAQTTTTPPAKPAPAAKPTAKPAASTLVDINSASATQLMQLDGVTADLAADIVKGRPYKAKGDLKTKKILTAAIYNKIAAKIVAKAIKK
jgi:DNA uptake protein ComE-like DNA-binding protein